jgi:anaerobic magnesium-protoporphyrin IX monomethyl ester cyclase
MPDMPGNKIPDALSAQNSGIALIGLNARFSHSCLSIRYLKSYLQLHWPDAPETTVSEWTINDPPYMILRQLYSRSASVYAFSCSIWNIGQVSRLSSQLKKILPGSLILWGGP